MTDSVQAIMPRDSNTAHARFNQIAEAQLDAAWRVAKRCGVTADQIDDVIQEVFIIVCRRLPEIALGSERSFVMGATVRVAANWRRAQRRRPEEPLADMADAPIAACAASQDAAVAERQGLELLDSALACMTETQREVFILTELEQLTAREISEQLQVQEAAVVSRLRRARETFRHFCDERQLAVERCALPQTGAVYDA